MNTRRTKPAKKALKAVLLILALWVAGHLIYTTANGLISSSQKADVAVILGSKVNEDGTLSKRLQARLACGDSLYKSGQVKHILISGGLGKEGFYEGTKMRDYLVQRGIPDSGIAVDNMGSNTGATVANTFRLKDSLHFRSVIVVSQFFHVTRTKMLFRKAHFQNVRSASPAYFEWRDFYSLAREFPAYYLQ